ncbi:MAG TPA: glyceraldehyde 3-phosphate dehydrogenase NAD-binding domain-containing protein [Lentimicrobium sp.]|nr:glyceraldehyde 3-phosphate dehydrogenase NAD-binding domain-containing protein [Lentimicrobium sp.]
MERLHGKNLLGINGAGRIGKLTIWNHLLTRHFGGLVVNVGRGVGKNLESLIHNLTNDSTYGSLSKFLYGHSGKKCEINILDSSQNLVEINGMPVKFLMTARNPKEIGWADNQVRLVVDCTGAFLDPTVPADNSKGSLRGHLEAGADKVIASAPFKIKDSTQKMPSDASMMVYGINHLDFDARKHHVLSAASCTTTGLSHMMLPLLERPETSHILTASMSTIHASTSTQSILDAVPSTGTSDLRKSRSVFNNIIITSTGAAKALEKIIPEVQRIGFMADSVRIPINTASLIILNITFQSPLNDIGEPVITREYLNQIYKETAEGPGAGMLEFSEEQNVSADIIGRKAAIVIEGVETHTRTGFMGINPDLLQNFGVQLQQDIMIPVCHAKIFGWYDNEFGSYVNMLGKLTEYIDKKM